MKRSKTLKIVLLVGVMVLCFCTGAVAVNKLEKIQAYLNYGITVKLDGETQTMYDGNGKRVYPISYQGTTYVPIRAVSNMLGIDVAWDSKNYTVLLGENDMVYDFIEEFEPYAGDIYTHYSRKDGSTQTIAGKTYDHFIQLGYGSIGYEVYYDLGGAYEELNFKAYSGVDSYLNFYGDNGELLEKILVEGEALPEAYSIDVTGVQQLHIEARNYGYIFDATIE
ncbi:MAG: NPCBM/NEW2 domain-containing protein [Butyricicoccus sp.]|nr:NPCBM/NEW2 domain-containing protein [Butyricicoccus sp.]